MMLRTFYTGDTWIKLLRRVLFMLLLAAVFASCFTTRLVPFSYSDRAVFISVAEYIRSGSRLYVDIYDNKDPLFYYAVSGQRILGPFAEYGFELLTVGITAVCAYDISKLIGCSQNKRQSKLLIIALPFLVTGAFWEPGLTHLPATALSLLACDLFLRGKLILAGGSIGLVVFVKLIMFPLPATFCLAYEFLTWNNLNSLKRIRRLIAGFILVGFFITALLLAKQELVAYLQTQWNNVFYSQSPLIDNSSPFSSFASHLRTMFLGAPQKHVLLASLIAIVALVGYLSTRTEMVKQKATFMASLATCAVSVVILGLTGLWDHHLQLIYFSQVLMLTCVVTGLNFKGRRSDYWSGLLVLMLALLLSGSTSWRFYIESPTRFVSKTLAVAAASTEAKDFRSEYPSGAAFARLGQNTSVIPYGAPNDKLVCPDFHQYYFYDSAKLDRILACASTAPVLLVDDSFTAWKTAPGWLPQESQIQVLEKNWNDFVAAGEKMIQANFSCKTLEEVRICTKHDAQA